MVDDIRRIGGSALAMVQGMLDADAAPTKGLWLVTRGAQVLEREWAGQLAGAALWGFGKVAAREAAQLRVRMLDLDPADAAPAADVVPRVDASRHRNARSPTAAADAWPRAWFALAANVPG